MEIENQKVMKPSAVAMINMKSKNNNIDSDVVNSSQPSSSSSSLNVCQAMISKTKSLCGRIIPCYYHSPLRKKERCERSHKAHETIRRKRMGFDDVMSEEDQLKMKSKSNELQTTMTNRNGKKRRIEESGNAIRSKMEKNEEINEPGNDINGDSSIITSTTTTHGSEDTDEFEYNGFVEQLKSMCQENQRLKRETQQKSERSKLRKEKRKELMKQNGTENGRL